MFIVVWAWTYVHSALWGGLGHYFICPDCIFENRDILFVNPASYQHPFRLNRMLIFGFYLYLLQMRYINEELLERIRDCLFSLILCLSKCQVVTRCETRLQQLTESVTQWHSGLTARKRSRFCARGVKRRSSARNHF